MATQGTYTAYRQLKPLEGDVSDDIIKQEELGFKRNTIEQQRAKNKADAEVKAKELKQKELDKIKYPSNPDVKVQTLTDYGSKSLRMAANRIGELSSKLYSGKLLPGENEDDLRLELNNLQNTPELLKNSASALTTQAETYREKLAKGEIRPNLKFETFISGGANGWVPHFDSKGNFMTAFMDKDINGDGVIDKLDIASYEDLAGHTGMFKFDTAYDRKKLLEMDIKSIEVPVNTDDNGSIKTKTTGFKSLDKATGLPFSVLEKAKNTLYNQDGSPSDILRDFAYTSNIPLTIKNESGSEIPNQKGLEKAVLDYAREINAGLKRGVEKDVNLEREKMNQSERHFQLSRGDKKEEKRPKPIVVNSKNTAFIEDVVQSKEFTKDGKKYKTNPSMNKDILQKKGLSFPKGIPLTNMGGEHSELDGIEIMTVFKGKDDGKFYYTGRVIDQKSSGQKITDEDTGDVTYKYGAKYKSITREATGESISAIASYSGLNSEEELSAKLDKINGIKPGSKTATTKQKVYAGVDENGKIIYK